MVSRGARLEGAGGARRIAREWWPLALIVAVGAYLRLAQPGRARLSLGRGPVGARRARDPREGRAGVAERHDVPARRPLQPPDGGERVAVRLQRVRAAPAGRAVRHRADRGGLPLRRRAVRPSRRARRRRRCSPFLLGHRSRALRALLLRVQRAATCSRCTRSGNSASKRRAPRAACCASRSRSSPCRCTISRTRSRWHSSFRSLLRGPAAWRSPREWVWPVASSAVLAAFYLGWSDYVLRRARCRRSTRTIRPRRRRRGRRARALVHRATRHAALDGHARARAAVRAVARADGRRRSPVPDGSARQPAARARAARADRRVRGRAAVQPRVARRARARVHEAHGAAGAAQRRSPFCRGADRRDVHRLGRRRARRRTRREPARAAERCATSSASCSTSRTSTCSGASRTSGRSPPRSHPIGALVAFHRAARGSGRGGRVRAARARGTRRRQRAVLLAVRALPLQRRVQHAVLRVRRARVRALARARAGLAPDAAALAEQIHAWRSGRRCSSCSRWRTT